MENFGAHLRRNRFHQEMPLLGTSMTGDDLLTRALEDAGDLLADARLDPGEVRPREVHTPDEDHQESEHGDPTADDLAATLDEASEGLPGRDFGLLRLLPHGGR